MYESYNIGNSIFTGLNDKEGILICGYEWGFSKEDQEEYLNSTNQLISEAKTVFSNKSPAHGSKAFKWKYDNRIMKWFDIWGHPLSRIELGGNFEKCILQTNWCDTQNYKIEGDYYTKLTDKNQVENFLSHISEFEPQLILFFGSAMIDILQITSIIDSFCKTMGNITSPLVKLQKPYKGRRFKIGFQSFERCNVVSLPHPSSSRGLQDEYIKLFTHEVGLLIHKVKLKKGLVNRPTC